MNHIHDERVALVSPQSVEYCMIDGARGNVKFESRLDLAIPHNIPYVSSPTRTGASGSPQYHREPRWSERNPGQWGRPRIQCRLFSEQAFASWNVEGLGADNCKLSEVFYHMKHNGIAVLAMQETHVKGMHHFYQDGFLVILSGEDAEKAGRSWSGVGFVIASSALQSIVGFRMINDRLVSLKLRVAGGLLHVIAAYAPHSDYRYEVRKDFFDQLLSAWGTVGSHTCTMALGDFNAKLFDQMPGDEDVIGRFLFRSPVRQDLPQTNRELLLETCRATESLIANTYFDKTDENLVTYRALGVQPLGLISPVGFA